ncbi:MAG: hypothetical protein HYT87_00155 [Nitrospirae bacterium]|nr:hypothetical protein [Nitrospirota bacterium]
MGKLRSILVAAGASALLTSCFDVFETISFDTSWRSKYSMYLQTDVSSLVDPFEAALQSVSIAPVRGQKGRLYNLAHDGTWMAAGVAPGGGFQVSAEPGRTGRSYKLKLARSWTPDQVVHWTAGQDLQVLSAQSSKPGMYKLTLELPGPARSARMLKNGTMPFGPKQIKGGRVYWLLTPPQLVGMTSMDIEAEFTATMLGPTPAGSVPAKAASGASAGCENSPETLGRVVKLVTEVGRIQTDLNSTMGEKQSKYSSLLSEVTTLSERCAQGALGPALGDLKNWLAGQAPPPSAVKPKEEPKKPAPREEDEEEFEEDEEEE